MKRNAQALKLDIVARHLFPQPAPPALAIFYGPDGQAPKYRIPKASPTAAIVPDASPAPGSAPPARGVSVSPPLSPQVLPQPPGGARPPLPRSNGLTWLSRGPPLRRLRPLTAADAARRASPETPATCAVVSRCVPRTVRSR